MIRTSTDISQPTGKLWVVGIGPGDPHLLTPSARQALRTSHVVVGLHAYLEMIRPLLSDQQVIARPLTEEVERASEAVERAFGGQTVAIISSGDAGIYGMAGLVWELLAERKWSPKTGPEVEVVPGVSALNAAAALVGAPLMHDFAAISLSDLLTPWPLIRKRLALAAAADFVIVLYNPKSRRRTAQIAEAVEVVLGERQPTTPVALVKNAYRPGQTVVLTTLGEMLSHPIDMVTTVVMGNSQTFVYAGRMITPRGYRRQADAPSRFAKGTSHDLDDGGNG